MELLKLSWFDINTMWASTTKTQLPAFSLHLHSSIKRGFLVSCEKGKFLNLTKKTNLRLPADLRHGTETQVLTARPLHSIQNLNNIGLSIRLSATHQVSQLLKPKWPVAIVKHYEWNGTSAWGTAWVGSPSLPQSAGAVYNTYMLCHIITNTSLAFVPSFPFSSWNSNCEG